MVQQDLGIGLRCIKFLLVAFNVLFAMSGVLLVMTAAMVGNPMSELTPLLDQQFVSPALLLGGTGVAVIVVSCFGIWGAVRQSTALVTLFSVLLSVLLVLELGAGLSAFLLQDNLRQVLEDNIRTAMQRYESDPATAEAIDKMQRGLQCCGVNDPTDWLKLADHYPESCCSVRIAVDGDAQSCVPEAGEGCLRAMGLFVTRGSAFIASTAVVTAFTQFLGVLFACTLGRSIRQQKTLRDLRRNQLRDNLINSYAPLDTKPMPPITITY